MTKLTVSKTKDYLILKIPLRAVRRGKVFVSPRVERMITEGLAAYAHGRGAGPFHAKQEAAFLRTL